MQAALHYRHADMKNFADLGVGQPLDVDKKVDFAVNLPQTSDGSFDQLTHLVVER